MRGWSKRSDCLYCARRDDALEQRRCRCAAGSVADRLRSLRALRQAAILRARSTLSAARGGPMETVISHTHPYPRSLPTPWTMPSSRLRTRCRRWRSLHYPSPCADHGTARLPPTAGCTRRHHDVITARQHHGAPRALFAWLLLLVLLLLLHRDWSLPSDMRGALHTTLHHTTLHSTRLMRSAGFPERLFVSLATVRCLAQGQACARDVQAALADSDACKFGCFAGAQLECGNRFHTDSMQPPCNGCRASRGAAHSQLYRQSGRSRCPQPAPFVPASAPSGVGFALAAHVETE